MLTRSLITLLVAAILAPHCLAQSDLDGDFDGDGIIDRFDNCFVYPNPLQGDADADGWGNFCDTDLNNDGILNFDDLSLFSEMIFTGPGPADFNEDGVVNFLDLSVFRNRFANGRPGPAIVMRWVGGSGSWNDASNWLPPKVPNFLFETAIIDTPDDVVVTVEQGRLAGAKYLELDGKLLVCGSYQTFKTTTVNGTLTSGCGPGLGVGQIYLSEEIDLAGEIVLNSGLLTVSSVRNIGNADSVIRVTSDSQLEGFPPEPSVTTEVDIAIRPGAKLNVGSEIILVDAFITLQSDIELPAELHSGNSILGSGEIVFEGPADDSATGILRTFGAIDIGAGIEVKIEPNAYAYFNGQINNFGHINVTDSATLFFAKFDLTSNSGQITCSNNGRLAEIETGNPSSGDSILFNNAEAELIIENCTMAWPTRVLNSGVYNVTSSQIKLPAIAASNFPLEITNTDIHIEPFQPPVPDNFYLFNPLNENTVLLKGLFDLGNQAVEIDAAKWRFSDSPPGILTAIEFGTLVSATPLTVNIGANLRFEAVVLETDVNLEPAANLHIRQIVGLNSDIHFLEPEDCNSAPLEPAVLRIDYKPLDSSISKIRAESSAAPGDTSCLRAEIVTDRSVILPAGIDLVVSNADVKMYAEEDGGFTVEGEVEVSGPDSILTLQQTTIANFLGCSEGATILASGTAQKPFVNNALITANDCNISLSGNWLNNGEVYTSFGTLNITGPENTVFTPGSGTFISDRTDILFDMDIGNPSSLEVFKVIPASGALFTFSGEITDPGPEIDLADFPFSVRFGDGFELADTRMTGFGIFWLSGSAYLSNVELAATVIVTGNSTLNVFDQLALDDASLIIQSNSNDGASSTTRMVLHGVPNITGTGEVILQSYGEDAVSELVQSADDLFISIDAGIDTICVSGGRCTIRAGAFGGKIELFGDLLVADETSQLTLESDTSVYRNVQLIRNGQIHIPYDIDLTFTGPDSGLEIELLNTPMEPGITASGSATINISDATLSFVPGDAYVLGSEETVTVLSHEDAAQRIGEFVDVSGAMIDGFLFDPDYSSPDVTIFRGPTFSRD